MGMQTELVTIQKENRTRDGAGGENITLVNVATNVPAYKNWQRRTGNKYERLDESRGSGGPGVVTRTNLFFEFTGEPFPDVQVNYRIVDASGISFLVEYVRTYYDEDNPADSSMQADVLVNR